MQEKKANNLTGDIWGGIASALVALPSAIAFGIIIFSPLGNEFGAKGAIAGILGAIIVGLIASLTGGTPRLISAPAAPGAAVLAAFTAKLAASGTYKIDSVFLMVIMVTVLAGLFQFLFGVLGGGKFIKYIPYPVVAGFLTGVAILIFLSQIPKILGLPKEYTLLSGFFRLNIWNINCLIVGVVSIIIMFLSPLIIKSIPPAIISLVGGIITYFVIAMFNPQLLTVAHNKLIIGHIGVSVNKDFFQSLLLPWTAIHKIDLNSFQIIFVTALTLAILLSIDTLKTCVILDSLTRSRHNANRELLGQGTGNILSGFFGGIPGAGTMGATLVNVNSGGKTKLSGVLEGIFALLIFLVLGKLFMWIPFSALAGILVVVAYRMIDKEIFKLLSQKSTILDFFVIVTVVLTAVASNLLTAAGVGIAFAILFFLRDQIRGPVVRRKLTGSQTFSKKTRLPGEHEILIETGNNTIVFELQGALFFGTTDQLFNELEPHFSKFKCIVLDFKWVRSIDFTASRMLKQISEQINENKGILILSSITTNLTTGEMIKNYFEEAGLLSATNSNVKTFTLLDDALEWIEDRNLEKESGTGDYEQALDITDINIFTSLDAEEISAFRKYAKEKKFINGEKIFSKDDVGGEIFFIRKGMVKILLPLLGDNVYYHISTFSKGDFFGDISFLDNATRSADAVAEGEVEVYIISRKNFDNIILSHPHLAAVFFEKLAYVLAVRLRHTNLELQALEEI